MCRSLKVSMQFGRCLYWTVSVSKCVWTGYAWMSWNTSIQVNLIIININTQFDYQALIIYNAFVDIKY